MRGGRGRGQTSFQKFSDEGSGKKGLSEDRANVSKAEILKIVGPYLWPKSAYLRFRAFLVVAIIIAVRVGNIYVPIFYRNAVDVLSMDEPYVPTAMLVLYGTVRALTSIQRDLRTMAWLPVSQWTRRTVSVAVFEHLHSLSLRFHLTRKTGEVLRVIERGTSSIEMIFNMLVFNIIPLFLDVISVCVVFLADSKPGFAALIFVVISLYIGTTFWISEWRTKFRRRMVSSDNDVNTRAVDSLLNFETVKYFGGERHESELYLKKILEYQKSAWKSEATLALLDGIQALILNGGLIVGMLMSAKEVVDGTMTVGDVILVNTYIIQLAMPLNWLGTSYRLIIQSFVDMEKLTTLMLVDPDITDTEGAEELVVSHGKIEFKDVEFSYNVENPVLQGLSLTVEAGSSVAFVGPSGAGKSTIFRCLFRFYDLHRGSITIDGVDIKQVQQRSLRRSIGVVPQDTVLFNNTIMYNLKYGKPEATDEEVFSAAKDAAIHDKIMTFPDEYNTMVGERGLRLSGGEKQRVAIARTLLKNPAIVVLDEATSSLDTVTERQIQAALERVTKGRTTIVIAHRLSTVVQSDCIVVLSEGKVHESGKHDELLSRKGLYAELWQMQEQQLHEQMQEQEAQKVDSKL